MMFASLTLALVIVSVSWALPQGGFPDGVPHGQSQTHGPPPPPQINWGKCPQLKPTDGDQADKRKVIEQCLQQNPPPREAISEEQIAEHRESITTCALKTEGWFNDDGTYKFDRAKDEIQNKKLDAAVEPQILKQHEACKKEAGEKFPNAHVHQVQLYQGCMDYHISQICGIEVLPPPEAAFSG